MTSSLSELLEHIAFDDRDRARLAALHAQMEPRFSGFAARFTAAVRTYPGVDRLLSSPEQIERLHASLIDWMSSGLLGPHDEQLRDKRARLERRHATLDLAQAFLFTAMNVVRTGYHDLIVELYPAPEAALTIRSVNKLLDLELAIISADDGLAARERRMQADRISAMQTMTAGLAHEVRNPLNAAKLQLELLDRRLHKDAADPRLTGPTELAQREIERLTQLLNDFLAFARPPELHAQDHDVAAIVRSVVELERPDAESHRATLALVVAPETLVARCDAGKLQQIVVNLVRNALEAAPPGGHVTLELTGTSERFTIRVQDDGSGIPPEVQSRMFEPFFSTREGHVGLGMSIVHSLVALHGGAIEIDSGPRGTRFEITIPRRS